MMRFVRKNWLWGLGLAVVVTVLGGAAVAQILPTNGPSASPAGPTRPGLIVPVRPPLVSPILP